MKDVKFERELKNLIYYVLQYGIHRSTIKADMPNPNYDEMVAFVTNVHKGFMLAQESVVRNLTEVLQQKKKAKQQLKIDSRERNTVAKKADQNLLNKLEYQEYVFRKVIDSIAFILLRYELSDARRLYCGEQPIDITDSNLQSCIKYSQEIFQKDPMTFALISDLSSFIQAGDILQYRYGEEVSVLELKEGVVNEKVLETMRFYEQTKCDMFLTLTLEQEGPRFERQLLRTAKQFQKEQSIVDVINTGRGTDMFTGLNVNVIQDNMEFETFTETVKELLKDARAKGYAISIIDGCLPIGVYYNAKFPKEIFAYWMKVSKINAPIIDLRQSILDPTAYPIFLLGIPQSSLVDIVLGRVSILMSIDIDCWLLPLKQDGYKIDYIPKSKLQSTFKSSLKNIHPIMSEGKCVTVEKNGIKQFLQKGLLARMFTMLSTPSSMRKYIVEMFKQDQPKSGD